MSYLKPDKGERREDQPSASIVSISATSAVLTRDAHNGRTILLTLAGGQVITLWAPQVGDTVTIKVTTLATGGTWKQILPSTGVSIDLPGTTQSANVPIETLDAAGGRFAYITLLAVSTTRWTVLNYGQSAASWTTAQGG